MALAVSAVGSVPLTSTEPPRATVRLEEAAIHTAKLPVGVDFAGRPFSEPLLMRIAAAYTAASKHRPPPPEFSSVP